MEQSSKRTDENSNSEAIAEPLDSTIKFREEKSDQSVNEESSKTHIETHDNLAENFRSSEEDEVKGKKRE